MTTNNEVKKDNVDKVPYDNQERFENKEEFKQHLSKVFNKYFDKTGKDMTQVASQGGVSYTYVAQTRQGETAPNSYMLMKMAEPLNIPPGELFPELPSASQDYVEDYLSVIKLAHDRDITSQELELALDFIKQSRNLYELRNS